MKKLPIGLQSIEEIISGGYVYVDKTAFIHKLISEGKYYFVSRPRRFGKSLFVSTLKAVLKGDRKLFHGCKIDSMDYSWGQHPIIHLDFSQIATHSLERLEDDLKDELLKIARFYGKPLDPPISAQRGLIHLVEQLAQINKVVVLVDEYDKPIIDNLQRLETAEANRDFLRNFFGTLKGLDPHLKFVFVTGVSKFSQVSLFSGFNNLHDLTIHPEYATMLGYTEGEIRSFLHDQLRRVADKRNQSDDQTVEEMRQWYNGYRFSADKEAVYNPHSTLNFLSTGKRQGYWFRTGTPSFLIEQMKQFPQSAVEFSGSLAGENELLDIRNLRKINLKALMWQTGYLTIQKYDPSTHLYHLDFPNREVREAFFHSLLQEFAELESSDFNPQALECKKELEKRDLAAFFVRINGCFAKIPYNLFKDGNEGFYHAIFFSLLEAMGIKVRAEDKTNVGRIDLVCETSSTIYIFEFKMDRTAQEALQQIETKKYGEKYLQSGKEIMMVGANFSSKTRNISDWKSSLYSS